MPMPSHYFNHLRPGDLVLSGGRNFFSEITQLATGSRFGHVLVVVGHDRLVQATDIALTPPETDEGVFELSFAEFRNRTSTLSDIRVVRPHAIDAERLGRMADHLIEHSPTYPSVGAIVLGFCCAAARIVARLPPAVKACVIHYQFRLAADGPGRMHCAEFAFRLYDQAGVTVKLSSPVLADVIEYSRASRPELLTPRLERRRAEAGDWPKPVTRAAVYAVRESVTTLRDRLDAGIERDHAGLVLPADLERSPTFRPVFDISRRRRRWRLNQAA